MRPSPEDIQAVLYDQMVLMIGLLFGTLLTGILLTLGVSSIFLLSSEGGRSLSRRNRFLCVYIIVLLLVVLALDAEAFVLGNGFAVFFSQPQNKIQEILGVWGKVVGSTTLVIGLLADGIFVWRCFMVQRALGPYRSSKWGNIFWIFPACLWILTLVTGIVTTVLPGALDPAFPGVPGTISILSNSALCVYATLFIIIRLLVHRKLVITALGEKALRAMQHFQIVTILLESAAVNIPIAIATVVGLRAGQTFGSVTGLIAPPSQALASVIIIHQVALGRTFNRHRGDQPRTKITSGSGLDP